MPDTSAARIEIGGNLPTDKLPEFIKLVVDEGLTADFDGIVNSDNIEGIIEDAISSGEPLRLTDDTAPGGQFEHLEKELRRLGLTYCRSDDGHYTWTPTVVFWQPGMERPREWTGSVDGAMPHLNYVEILDLMDTGKLHEELELMEIASAFEFPFTVGEVPAEEAAA